MKKHLSIWNLPKSISACNISLSAEAAPSLNGSPARASNLSDGKAYSGTGTLPCSVSVPVQTEQPCSLKGSLSSDNIYSGLQGEGPGPRSQPGQGDLYSDFLVCTLRENSLS